MSLANWFEHLRSTLLPAARPPARRGRPGVRLEVDSLEDRSLPSATNGHLAPALKPHAADATTRERPFKEKLTVVSVSETGVIGYEGEATYFGHVTAVLNPDNTFVKTAANGDTAFGFVTPETESTGIITITGGTGRFEGATGLSDYVISVNQKTGATTVKVDGTLAFDPSAQQAGKVSAQGGSKSDTHALPFKITGRGLAPLGINVNPGVQVPHDSAGHATHLGKYTGDEGLFQILRFTGPLTGEFTGSFVFVAADGDRLAFDYGATTPGQFTIVPRPDGLVTVEFVADFTPIVGASTGRFAKVTGGSFLMIAHAEPFDPTPNAEGYTAPFYYTWQGEGTLEFAKGNK